MTWNTIFGILKRTKNLKQQRGAIVMLTALLLPLLLGFTGFAYDFGNLYMHKSRLQNVADAAALAGGRAFLESQTEANITAGTNDKIDQFPGANEGRAELEYKMTDNPNEPKTHSGSNHHAADSAADAYIIKNLANLGTNVHNDKYSHYALNSVDNPTGTEPKKFYRVGLYEDVPLYFLPVILDKKVQRVRAGAVVLVKEGQTQVIHHGGGEGDDSGVTSPSIFDNLFAFSEWLFTQNRTKYDGTDSTIKGSFTGNMVYTHLNNLEDGTSFRYSAMQPAQFFNAETDMGSGASENFAYTHLYEDEIGTKVNKTGGTINDPTIDTFYDTKAYLDAFKKLLLSPHVEIGQDSSGQYVFFGDCPVNAHHVYHVNGLSDSFYYSNSRFYFLDADGHYKTITSNSEKYQLCYCKLGDPWSDENSSQYVLCANKEGDTKYYFIDNNGNKSNYFIERVNDWTWQGTKDLSTYQSYGFTSNRPRNDFIQNSYSVANSNVFHIPLKRSDGQNNSTFTINIDQEIPDDEDSRPIYVLIDDIPTLKIESTNATATNNRPLILVFLSEKTTQIKYSYSGTFVGTIYAPISDFEHFNNPYGSFRGNVVAKTIKIEAETEMSFVQENFLEKYEYEKDANGNYILDANGKKIIKYQKDTNGNYILDANGKKIPIYAYLNADIKAVSDSIAEKIEAANQNANLTEELKNEIYSGLGLTSEEITAMNNNPNWYNEQTFGRKKSLYQNWRTLYESYPANSPMRNLLWPWNEHFGIESGEDEVVTTGDTLRIINFRTEFRDAPKDPFVDLALEDD